MSLLTECCANIVGCDLQCFADSVDPAILDLLEGRPLCSDEILDQVSMLGAGAIDTAGDEARTVRRRWKVRAWVVNTYLPTWLDFAGRTEEAARLRGVSVGTRRVEEVMYELRAVRASIHEDCTVLDGLPCLLKEESEYGTSDAIYSSDLCHDSFITALRSVVSDTVCEGYDTGDVVVGGRPYTFFHQATEILSETTFWAVQKAMRSYFEKKEYGDVEFWGEIAEEVNRAAAQRGDQFWFPLVKRLTVMALDLLRDLIEVT